MIPAVLSSSQSVPALTPAEGSSSPKRSLLLDAPTPINFKLIQIPPGKRYFFHTDWRRRFLFNFQLLPAEELYAVRKARAAAGTHPIDAHLSEKEVEQQCAVYEALALHFHRCGIGVFVRTSFDGLPRYVVDP